MKNYPRERLWTLNYVLITLVGVLAMFSSAIVNSTISMYIIDFHKGTASDVGLISSMMILTALIMRPVSGYAVDKWGRKWLFIITIVFSGLINLSMLLPFNLDALKYIRLLYGIPFAFKHTAMYTMINDVVPKDRRAEGYSYYVIITFLTFTLITPNIGFALAEAGNFSMIFILSAAVGFLSAIVMFVTKYKDVKNPSQQFNFGTLFEGRVILMGLIMGLIFMGMPAVGTFSPQYSREVGFSTAGVFLLMYSTGMIVSRFSIKRIFDNSNPQIAGLFALFFIGAGFALTGFVRNAFGLIAGGGLMGLGYGTANSTFTPLGWNLVEENKRGVCNSTFIFCQDVGIFVGMNLFGRVSQFYGSYAKANALYSIIVVVVIAIFLIFTVPDYRRKYAILTETSDNLPID